ncbi:hypothetical protein ES703_114554 [subsurface metagenome]
MQYGVVGGNYHFPLDFGGSHFPGEANGEPQSGLDGSVFGRRSGYQTVITGFYVRGRRCRDGQALPVVLLILCFRRQEYAADDFFGIITLELAFPALRRRSYQEAHILGDFPRISYHYVKLDFFAD